MIKKIANITVLMSFLLQTSTTFSSTNADLKTINFYAEYSLPKKDKFGNILASACAFDKITSENLALATISEYYANKDVASLEVFANKYTVNTDSLVVAKTMKSEIVHQSVISNQNGLKSTCSLVKFKPNN
ncbi:hypothetical protein UA32_12620 [Photobacterium angustum]|uniref:Excinuclease ATPase subunit n=1 Tax=Photobacterium angustum TaxID=661 RepID=A0ABX5H1W5_PHOAN|nr:hypothetical protein [Photobacterium angustum]KJG37789.1 hypothetical protein UA32_12620 [Photobacterium angustum]PSX07059.1 hypothetical protein C0W27_15940 [Photobacterium angustum]